MSTGGNGRHNQAVLTGIESFDKTPESMQFQDVGQAHSDGSLPPLLGPVRPLVDFVARLNASVHTKLVGGFFLGALLLLGTFILSLMVVHQMSQHVGTLNRSQEKVDIALQMERHLFLLSRLKAQALFTSDDSRNVEIDEAQQMFDEYLKVIVKLSPERSDQVRRIRAAAQRFDIISSQASVIYNSGNIDEALKIHLIDEHLVSEELNQEVRNLVNDSRKEVLASRTSFRSAQRFLEFMIVTTSFISLVLAMLMGLILSWSFIRPIWKINNVLAKIASGDFNHRVDVSNRDEFGALAANVNITSQQLADLYEKFQSELAEKEALARNLVLQSSQLEAANHELEAFSYSVSHDLRAPLRSLDGFSQALVEDYGDKLGEDGIDYLQRISAASHRMGELIDDLLGLSRVTRSEMVHERVDLSAVARDVAESLKTTETGRDVRFVIEDGATAQGDPHLLRVVMENLMGNAWKYTGKSSDATVEFGVQKDSDTPIYFVRDNGVGFDMAYVDKLFNPFQRLHSTSEFEGTGIGLATVRRIIKRHAGDIWPESEVGRGATFFFTIG